MTRAGAIVGNKIVDRDGRGHAPARRDPQRRRPESNRCKRLCRPLRNHSATSPCANQRTGSLVGRARTAADHPGAQPVNALRVLAGIACVSVTVAAVLVAVVAWRAMDTLDEVDRAVDDASRSARRLDSRTRDLAPAVRDLRDAAQSLSDARQTVP
jgi:hypothetical protein